MTAEDARYYAKTMGDLERKVIALCLQRQSLRYSGLAEKLGVTYAEVQSAGAYLQAANLATIETTRRGSEYSGSAIFLNERGEQVRQTVARSEAKKMRVQD